MSRDFTFVSENVAIASSILSRIDNPKRCKYATPHIRASFDKFSADKLAIKFGKFWKWLAQSLQLSTRKNLILEKLSIWLILYQENEVKLTAM